MLPPVRTDRSQFERDGYAVVPDILSADEVDGHLTIKPTLPDSVAAALARMDPLPAAAATALEAAQDDGEYVGAWAAARLQAPAL